MITSSIPIIRCLRLLWIFAALFGSTAGAQAPAARAFLYTPMQDAKVILHPLYPEHPGAPKDAPFSYQENASFAIYHRATGVIHNSNEITAIVFTVRNLNPTETVTIKPKLDLVDAGGQVLSVMDFKALLEAFRSASSRSSQQQSFFAFGNQQFVGSAMAGYAIGSALSELNAASRREKASKIALLIEKYWLKDEYRIPPSAYAVAWVTLQGLPKLPLTSRITIGDSTFVFASVSTEAEAEANAPALRPN